MSTIVCRRYVGFLCEHKHATRGLLNELPAFAPSGRVNTQAAQKINVPDNGVT
jgi:hypothetical protein